MVPSLYQFSAVMQWCYLGQTCIIFGANLSGTASSNGASWDEFKRASKKSTNLHSHI